MIEKNLKEIMATNEALCIRLNNLNKIVEVYKQALTELKAHPEATKALDAAKILEKRR